MLNRDVFHTDPDDYRIANEGVAKVSFPPLPKRARPCARTRDIRMRRPLWRGLARILDAFLRSAGRGLLRRLDLRLLPSLERLNPAHQRPNHRPQLFHRRCVDRVCGGSPRRGQACDSQGEREDGTPSQAAPAAHPRPQYSRPGLTGRR